MKEKLFNYLRWSLSLGLFRATWIYFLKLTKSGVFSIKLPSVKYPFYLRSKSTDIPTFEQIFVNNEYDIELDFTPQLIIDAGANIGLFSIFFINKFPTSNIIAIEPEESNFNCLKENTKNYQNITCMRAALWNKPATLEVKDVGLGSWGFITTEAEAGNKNSIKAITIDNIITEYNLSEIDILKMDIEGAEKEVFENNYSSWLPKVKVLIIELHDHIKIGCSQSLFNAIIKYDFKFQIKGENLIFIRNN